MLESEIEEALNQDVSGLTVVPVPPLTLTRPLLITRSHVCLDGRGAKLVCNENFDGLVLGAPALFPDPADHLATDAGTSRLAFRTHGTAVLSFRGTPFDLGPVATASAWRLPVGYGTVGQFQADLWVRRHAADWSGIYHLAGIRGPTNDTPGPWYIEVWETGEVRFRWKGPDGQVRTAAAPIPAANPEDLTVSIACDWSAGQTVAIAVNAQAPVVTSVPAAGCGFFADHAGGHAGLGGLDDNGQPAAGPDLSFLGLRLSIEDLPDPPAGAEWFTPTPATLFLLPLADDPADYRHFVRWSAGAAGAGYPGYTAATGYGLLINSGVGEARPIRVQVRDLTIEHPGSVRYGAGLRSFPILELAVRGLRAVGGSHGVYLPFGHTNSYPVSIEDLVAEFTGLAGIQLDNAISTGRNWTLKYSHRNAVLIRSGGITLDAPVFYAASQHWQTEPIEDAFRFDAVGSASLRGVVPNFEGSAPRRSYYRFSPSAEQSTRVRLEQCAAERADGPLGLAAAVLLEGAPLAGKSAHFASALSFPDYAGPELVAGPGSNWKSCQAAAHG